MTPLREGGSLPAIVEADDDGLYVLKFRGAGQGPRALVAELVSGEIARVLGLPVPEIVFVDLDQDLARTEPDPEIHQLIHDSAGLNLALDYLPGSVAFDPLVHTLDAGLMARIVWFDALVSNVDRTARNTNMLMWHRRPWLIDHGASLYFHHAPGWQADESRARAPFTRISTHVLRHRTHQVTAEDAALAAALDGEVLDTILSWVPEAWLDGDAATTREAYARYFRDRLTPPRAFAEEAARVR
ncbi:MAG: HipA family kinase [Vicinamibacterales bacterium]